IVFKWILFHCGILGNENADALAKKGSTATYRPVTKSTYYSVKRFIKSTYLDFNKQNLITQSEGKNGTLCIIIHRVQFGGSFEHPLTDLWLPTKTPLTIPFCPLVPNFHSCDNPGDLRNYAVKLTGFLKFGKDSATLPPRGFDGHLSILLNEGCDWLLTREDKISVTVRKTFIYDNQLVGGSRSRDFNKTTNTACSALYNSAVLLIKEPSKQFDKIAYRVWPCRGECNAVKVVKWGSDNSQTADTVQATNSRKTPR
ncbi:hypothetical protein ANN_00458, partial [Periplaneta americana]